MSVSATPEVINLASDQAYLDEGVSGVDEIQVEKRYGEERAKRLREDGPAQWIDISLDENFKRFQDDPWVDPDAVNDVKSMFPDGSCQLLIIGAGFGGLMYAVRMVQAGVHPEYIRIVDPAGGFGGTWYHNRFPGLMCDIESYCYLPLLEETGYMPKHRYSYGEEIRKYAEDIADKWNITNSAVFQTKAEKLLWDETAKEWQVELVQRKGNHSQDLTVRSKFVATVNGVLNWPKLPGFPGILDFQGKIFHSARWDYSITGGSQGNPSLTRLKDKRVAIVGTGATAVQIVPHLARWSKHLYVVQRTPASVDRRDQRPTDPEWFHKQVATAKGWQRERLRNFHNHFRTGEKPSVNVVDDQWTESIMLPISGNPDGPTSMEELPAYMKTLNALDLPRQASVRARCEKIVKDHKVAQALQPWYPTWCKRPAYHDDYYPSFNQDNVTLIDTEGKGPDCITADSIIVGNQSLPVDIIIFATGYRAPFGGTPAEKANLTITGLNGVSMTQEWARNGPTTLHGVIDKNFPNLFLSGPWQASTSPNFLFNVDELAKHASYILSEAKRRAGGKPFAVAPTAKAVEDWGMQVLMRAAPMAAIVGCTPNYFNLEGKLDQTPPEMQTTMAKSGLWGKGIEDFVATVEAWRVEGSMQGIEVVT